MMDTGEVGMFLAFVLLLYTVTVSEIERRGVALQEEFRRDERNRDLKR